MKIDIHNVDRRLEREHERLKKLPKEDQEVLRKFENYCKSVSISKYRIVKYLYSLRKFAGWLGKPLKKAKKEDIERVLSLIEDMDYSAWTKHDYKAIIKRFYTWLNGGVPPESVSWIKTIVRKRDILLPNQLLSEEEVIRMINTAKNIRDKAFIAFLYESGCRISEVAGMRLKDVVFKENYATAMVKGKTGSRKVIIVAATPYLVNWIENHPLRDNPDAPMWVNIGSTNHLKPMSYSNITKTLKDIAKRAGIKKKVHPHKLRHSRATELAKNLTEAQMNQLFGWRQGSRMPAIYVHLSGRDIEDTMLKIYGLKNHEEKRTLKPRTCPRCGTVNQFEAKFCAKCGLFLDAKEAYRKEEEREKLKEKMEKVLSILEILDEDPELKERLLTA